MRELSMSSGAVSAASGRAVLTALAAWPEPRRLVFASLATVLAAGVVVYTRAPERAADARHPAALR
jgi:hypothetical protein